MKKRDLSSVTEEELNGLSVDKLKILRQKVIRESDQIMHELNRPRRKSDLYDILSPEDYKRNLRLVRLQRLLFRIDSLLEELESQEDKERNLLLNRLDGLSLRVNSLLEKLKQPEER